MRVLVGGEDWYGCQSPSTIRTSMQEEQTDTGFGACVWGGGDRCAWNGMAAMQHWLRTKGLIK